MSFNIYTASILYITAILLSESRC